MLVRSWIGRNFAAIRLNEDLAQTLGINTFRYKLLAFTVSNMLAAFAGALFGFYTNYIEPSQLSITQSLDAIAMVLLGGMGSIWDRSSVLPAHGPAARNRVLGRAAGRRLRCNPDPGHPRDATRHCRDVLALAPCFLRLTISPSVWRPRRRIRRLAADNAGRDRRDSRPQRSGKTTLLNLLAGLLVPTSGKVVWQGRNISGAKPENIAAWASSRRSRTRSCLPS